LKVLAAEDNPVFQSMLRAMLTKWGYDPVIARDGLEARAIEQTDEAVVRRLHAQRFARVNQLLLQLQNPASGAQANPKLMRVEWLGQVVIGAGVHAVDQVLTFGAGGQQNHVHVRLAGSGAGALADFDTVDTWHHPVEDGEAARRSRRAAGGGTVGRCRPLQKCQ